MSSPATSTILPVSLCTFSHIGITSIIYHLSQHPQFRDVDASRLRAAAIAFLCAGATTDGNHAVHPHRFHPMYYDLNIRSRSELTWRQGLREWSLQAIMDQVG